MIMKLLTVFLTPLLFIGCSTSGKVKKTQLLTLNRYMNCRVLNVVDKKNYPLIKHPRWKKVEANIGNYNVVVRTEGGLAIKLTNKIGVIMANFIISSKSSEFKKTDKALSLVKGKATYGETNIIFEPGADPSYEQLVTYFEGDENHKFKLFCKSAMPWRKAK